MYRPYHHESYMRHEPLIIVHQPFNAVMIMNIEVY